MRGMQRVVVWVIVLALALTGVGIAALSALDSGDGGDGGGTPLRQPTSSRAPDADVAPDPALAAFYGQRPDWQRCRKRFFCATVRVPLDYRRPDGDAIDLALLMVPAGGRRIGSLVVNPGGPGAPGTDYAAAADQVFGRALREHFDIVGFDPRGVGDSRPVDCLSDDELTAYIAADPDPDTPAEEQRAAELAKEFAAGCEQRSGELAGHVSTVEAARDMDVIRSALGESTLTYLGASYGTQLGATYAELFPAKVGRFVLDGAVDPSLSTREVNLQQAVGFETALRAYVANCVEKSDHCFLGESTEAGLATIQELMGRIDAEPLPADGGRELTEGDAFLGVALPLYSRDYWLLLTQALRAALDGDGDPLLELSDLYNERTGNHYANNSAEAIFAINCLDDPWAIPADQVESEIPAFTRAAPTFGRVFAWMGLTCLGQRLRAAEPAPEIDAEGAAPIVVIGTTRDPATPYAWARSLAEELASGVLISRDGDGHTGYNSGNDCVDNAVEDYLVDGTVPRDGLSC